MYVCMVCITLHILYVNSEYIYIYVYIIYLLNEIKRVDLSKSCQVKVNSTFLYSYP